MFNSRPQSQFLKPAPPKRISLPSSQRLNTILESNPNNPNVAGPSTTANRHQSLPVRSASSATQNRRISAPVGPASQPEASSPIIQEYGLALTTDEAAPAGQQHARTSHLGGASLPGDSEKPPPSYSQLSGSGGSGVDLPAWLVAHYERGGSAPPGVDGLPDTAPSGMRSAFTSRGGWKRLAVIIGVVLLIVAIALGVGLGVGLTRDNGSGSNSSSNSGSSTGQGGTSSQNTTVPFPLGLWTFNVVLASVNSSCAANSATWSCPPYVTYGQQPSQAGTSFSWNISRSGSSDSSLQIASSGNVFSLTFPETPLQGSSAGPYTFSVPISKAVQPRVSLGSDNSQDTCYFNQTVVTGTLSLAANPPATGSSGTYASWPGSLYLEERIPGGQNVPDCYSTTGAHVGGLAAQPAANVCSCVYESANGTMTLG